MERKDLVEFVLMNMPRLRKGIAPALLGECLMELRDRKLYRERYQTFEAWCRELGFSRQYAYRLIAKALAARNVATPPETYPLEKYRAAQARLARLEQPLNAWRERCNRP